MDADLRTILTSALISAPGIAALAWQIIKDRRKAPLEDADTAVDTSSSAAQALKSYSDEVIRLRGELASVRIEFAQMKSEGIVKDALIEEWRCGIDRLIAQMKSVNMIPVWKPRNGDGGDIPCK